MCNRYGHWASISALRARARQLELDLVIDAGMDNLEPRQNIYSDQDAPILINHEGGLKLVNARWGLPSIPHLHQPVWRVRDEKGRKVSPRNNIRKAGFWSQRVPDLMLEAKHRTLIPFSAFAEPVRDSTWYSVPDEEVAFFAGVCMEWTGERLMPQPLKKRRVPTPGNWMLFSFLTTEANSIVAPVHPDAMPAVLTDPEDCLEWLAGGENSLGLQRPLPDHQLILSGQDESQ